MDYKIREALIIIAIAIVFATILGLFSTMLRYLDRETIRATAWPPTSTPYTPHATVESRLTVTPMAFIPRDWEETDPLYPLIQGGHWNFKKVGNEGYRQ